jgi:hypothetical protein
MLIACRKRWCDLRASASAASILVRPLATSTVAGRRLAIDFFAGFAGRPGKRRPATCFGVLLVLGFFGIAPLCSHFACKVFE